MNVIEVFEDIDAPPAVVWDVLLEFDSYPEWNPFVRSIEGDPTVEAELEVRIKPPGSRGMTFTPVVVAAEENRRLAWLGRLGVPFIFDGYHEFHLDSIDGGERTRLLHRETFRGVLVPFLFDEQQLERGFRAMNEALKARAEERVQSPTNGPNDTDNNPETS
ncbi:SRPBCC domain-containing protein [Natrialba asiatica]|uniref:Polyketide cyclase/dehydrase n=1 Tax=Natrialba asiatica (strain ATCC 700177 / DSM 12278 / JCM 9576 / FERM P-10747 / NBRC 102637 / 172P1) TaxID=29540 RepID=M0AVH9_NATA1|nr:SRPBCC domain-containing protein [Natrialba asiatica]ELZ01958.1 polyketide cyclase/dehydrase [Natrialba asiatica DSM 12278]